MSAGMVMLLAWGLLILGHWANNTQTLSIKQIIEMVVAILIIVLLDQSEATSPIARGLAWLFLVAVLLGNKSILTSLSKAK